MENVIYIMWFRINIEEIWVKTTGVPISADFQIPGKMLRDTQIVLLTMSQ